MLEKNLVPLYVREKNYITRGLGKKILTQTKSHPPPLKSQMVGPLVYTKTVDSAFVRCNWLI